MIEFNAKILFDMFLELWGMICSKLGILAFIYALIFLMVLLDLWSGVKKAKKRKEYTSSTGLRRTADKLAKYYNVIFALTVADLLQMGFFWHYNSENGVHIPLLPFVTAAGAFFVCFVEIKSICESADKKMKGQYQEAMKQMGDVLKHKDKLEMLSALLSTLSSKEEENNDENSDGTGK